MTVSEFSKSEIKSRYGISKDILVGKEGWQHAVASCEDEESILKKYALTAGNYILCVGSIKPNKNLEIIPKALAILGSFSLPIVVAGNADKKIFMQADVAEDSIRPLGFVDDSHLGVLYKNARWFLFPSLYEGFGLPAIEAMANGCPVISSTAGSLPEVCASAALYFDPLSPSSLADVLRNIADNEPLRNEMISRHADRLEQYSWRLNAEILIGEVMRCLRIPSKFLPAGNS